MALGEGKHQITTGAVPYPHCSSPNPPGICQPVAEGAHTSIEQQSQGSGTIQRHHLCGYLLHHFGGLLSWLPSQGAAAAG